VDDQAVAGSQDEQEGHGEPPIRAGDHGCGHLLGDDDLRVDALVHDDVADLGHANRCLRPRRAEAGADLLATAVGLLLTRRQQRKLIARVRRMELRQVIRGQGDHRAMKRR
jgi:hypothetical protein